MEIFEQPSFSDHQNNKEKTQNNSKEIVVSDGENVEAEDLGDAKQYLADKFIKIFKDNINKPNPIYSKENILENPDPEVMRIMINTSLKELCDDSGVDPKIAEKIKASVNKLEFAHGVNKNIPQISSRGVSFNHALEEHLTNFLFNNLEEIFPDEIVKLIRKNNN